MSGQSIADRLTAAKHSIAGQGLAKTVCKSTTEEVMGPKRKHLDYLLQCTNEPNVSIPQLADLLIERTQNSSWVIVFKALITIHNLMNYGNERFTQYLASNNCSFNLASFIDKTGVQGYDMSTFVRRYAKYLNEKAVSYRLMAFDFCKVKRGRDDGLLRTMNSEKLLKSLPALQKLIDALLEFDCTANELTNGVINACFMLMFKDLIRLFACYNDGTINLLEKYFDMNKKNCRDALDIYKKFLVRMDKVSEFLKTAENVGIDKGDIPDLAKGLSGKAESAPASLLDALEEHLKSLESKKGGGVAGPKPSGFNSAVSAMASNSTIQVSDDEKKKILEEEGKQLQQLKETHPETPVTVDLFSTDPQEQKSKDPPATASPSQPPPSTNNPFGNQPDASAGQNASPIRPSDDLLNLTGNPFVENVQNVMNMNSGVNAFGAPVAGSGWGGQQMSTGGGFGAQNSFASFPTSNGTAGTSMSTLDSSTLTTSALPLAPSPTTVPSDDVTFDPYEPLVVTATSDGVNKEGSGGDLFSFSPTEETPQDGALGRQSPAVPRSVSPNPNPGVFSGNVFASDAFAGTFDQNKVTSDAFSGNFGQDQPTGDLFSANFGQEQVSSDAFSANFGKEQGASDAFSANFGKEQVASDAFSANFGKEQVGSDAFSGNFGQDKLSTDAFPTSGAFSTSETDLTGFDAFGEILQPQGTPTKQPTTQKQEKLSSQDLDSNLALLAGNIGINGANSVKKQQHQWKPSGDQKLTGGNNWQQPNISTATSSGWAQPQAMPVRPMMGYGQPGMQQPMMQPGMAPMGAPMMMQGGMAPMGNMPMTSMPQMNMGMRQPMYGQGYMAPGTQPMGMPQQQPPPSQPNDPFGAL